MKVEDRSRGGKEVTLEDVGIADCGSHRYMFPTTLSGQKRVFPCLLALADGNHSRQQFVYSRAPCIAVVDRRVMHGSVSPGSKGFRTARRKICQLSAVCVITRGFILFHLYGSTFTAESRYPGEVARRGPMPHSEWSARTSYSSWLACGALC